MKTGFYTGIAGNNLKKNARFFLPRILTEAGLLGCFYILLTLSMDSRLREIRGGEYIPTFMVLGVGVMVILSAVLMFYVNSFLMKQRTTELALYHVLGMEKRHVRRVLFWENAICSLISIVLGLIFGILFYKISSLAICRLLRVEVILGFYFIRAISLLPSALFFLGLDLVIYLVNGIRIARMNPVEMMRHSHAGEKEPAVRRLVLLLGLISLGAGYYIALTTKSPLLAISRFFEAVILVIIGTYALFTAGTIWVLKFLKRREDYYYDRRRMPAISGLLYRMKQNAVGLASICILSTGVLVMISTTFSLYAGIEETLAQHYPDDWYVNASITSEDGSMTAVEPEILQTMVEKAAAEQDLTIEGVHRERFLTVSFLLDHGILRSDQTEPVDLDQLTTLVIMTADDYSRMTGRPLALHREEVIVCPYTAATEAAIAGDDGITLEDMHLTYAGRLEVFPVSNQMNAGIRTLGLIVADEEILQQIDECQRQAYGEHASRIETQMAVNFAEKGRLSEVGDAVSRSVREQLSAYSEEHGGSGWGMKNDSIWDSEAAVYGMYGTLLFLGILLGLVFLFATVLIIYYKQISEGFEDRGRFQIMEKIGMSGDDVKRTIRSQILMVFFLPLAAAGIHTVMAFPILTKLLHVMLLSSDWLFVKCTLGVYLGFALIYGWIYRATSRTYYTIVR